MSGHMYTISLSEQTSQLFNRGELGEINLSRFTVVEPSIDPKLWPITAELPLRKRNDIL